MTVDSDELRTNVDYYELAVEDHRRVKTQLVAALGALAGGSPQ